MSCERRSDALLKNLLWAFLLLDVLENIHFSQKCAKLNCNFQVSQFSISAKNVIISNSELGEQIEVVKRPKK